VGEVVGKGVGDPGVYVGSQLGVNVGAKVGSNVGIGVGCPGV